MKKTILSILILCSMALAGDTKPETKTPPQPTKTEAKLPTVPEKYMSRFQALVIQQKDQQNAEAAAINSYKAAAEKMAQLNSEGTKLQNEMLSELKLDPEKYQVIQDDKGYLVIQDKPQEKK